MPADRLLIAGMIALLSVPAWAGQEASEPSQDLLEFLGTWENLDGQWVDPTQLQDMSMLGQASTRGETHDQ